MRTQLMVAACILVPFVPRAYADVLLRDTFSLTAPNPDTMDVNFQINTRQSGSLAPVTYTKADEPIFSQVGNIPNALLLACRSAGTRGEVSLDHNFTVSTGTANAFVIQFDVNPVLLGTDFNETLSSWVALDFGSSAAGRNQFPQFTDGMSILFRGDGLAAVFDQGHQVGPEILFADGSDDLYHPISIVILDPTMGTPFAGGPESLTILAYADNASTPFFSYVRPTAFSSNYLSFVAEGEGSGGDGVVRHGLTNLVISTEPVPEPASLMLLAPLGLLLSRKGTKSKA